jgi:hypothetical protein
MKRNDIAPPIEAELNAQLRRLTERVMVASARARTGGASCREDIAHMVRLAGAAADVSNATVRLFRASYRPRVERKTFSEKF